MKFEIILAIIGAILVFAVLKLAGMILQFALIAALAGLVAGFVLGRMLKLGRKD